MVDYYKELGINRSADEKEIRQAYRKLARKYHPDLNPGDDSAEDKFKQINEAYEVLSDSDTRSKYDRYGENWKNADQIQSGGYGFGSGRYGGDTGGRRSGTFSSDWFGDLDELLGRSGSRFGRRGGAEGPVRRETDVNVTLEEAFAGTMRNVTMSTSTSQRRIEVTIPPGVDTGSVVRYSVDAENEVILNVKVTAHKRFKRKGNDIEVEVEVPFEDAILGGSVEVDTLRGRVELTIPPESQNGQRIRLAGQGMPVLNRPESNGDLYVILRPKMPIDLTDDERELLTQLKNLRSERE